MQRHESVWWGAQITRGEPRKREKERERGIERERERERERKREGEISKKDEANSRMCVRGREEVWRTNENAHVCT